jgi:hypothetical protein
MRTRASPSPGAIHVFFGAHQDVDGRNSAFGRPGHDETVDAPARAASAALVALACLRTRDLVPAAANYRARDVKWRRCKAK